MRIAISGAHHVGKSTLVAELQRRLPSYEAVDEPWYELLDEGHAFSERVSGDDIVPQLERCIERLGDRPHGNVIHDRCPADFLAYLTAVTEKELVREWIVPVQESLSRIDVIVFVPIEEPDRITSADRSDSLRRTVDAVLRDMLTDDGWGFGAVTVEVRGSESDRAAQVIEAMRQHFDHHQRQFRA